MNDTADMKMMNMRQYFSHSEQPLEFRISMTRHVFSYITNCSDFNFGKTRNKAQSTVILKSEVIL